MTCKICSPDSPELVRLDLRGKTGQFINQTYLNFEHLEFENSFEDLISSPFTCISSSSQTEVKTKRYIRNSSPKSSLKFKKKSSNHKLCTTLFRVCINGQMREAHCIGANHLTLDIVQFTPHTDKQSLAWFGGIIQLEASLKNDRLLVIMPMAPKHPYHSLINVHFESSTKRTQFIDECLALKVIRLATENDVDYYAHDNIGFDSGKFESFPSSSLTSESNEFMEKCHMHDSSKANKTLDRSVLARLFYRMVTPTINCSKPNIYEPVLSPIFYQ